MLGGELMRTWTSLAPAFFSTDLDRTSKQTTTDMGNAVVGAIG